MEVAIDNNKQTPFQKEIREWQHVDPNTGALLTGRLEADRWVNGPLNTYGKMISHNLSTPDGTQHTHRKQMEILQARTSSGSLQVVRAQTVQTSSSRWSSSTSDYNSHNGNYSHQHLVNGDGGNYNAKQQQQQQQQQSFKAITANGSYSNGHASPVNLSNLLHSATNGNGPHDNSHYSQSQVQSQSHQYNGYSNGVHHPEQPSLLQSSTKHLRSSLLLPTSDNGNQQHKLNKFDVVGGNVYRNNMTKHMDLNQNFNSERENHIITESSFVRGKSVSTEDLSADRNELNFDEDVEPSEWKRVSKIRRSLQFPRSSAQKSFSTRPPDLPENSVSVWKIKQEIENGRRLSTAMRNNHVDFVALDNILKGVGEPEPKAELKHSKKATIITAESLKEIRGKLRRLSDESLYKDDMSPSEDSNQTEFELPTSKVTQEDMSLSSSKYSSDIMYTSPLSTLYNSNSLESKTRKEKDGSSDDWNSRERRKSYGFEKMKAPAGTLEKMESSTDSGLGRSSDLNSLWSPTDSAPSKGTIVTLGDHDFKSQSSSTSIALFNGNHEIRQNNFNLTKTYEKPEENKRHSIAVDETRYVRENLRKVFDGKSMIHLNGAYNNEEISTSQEGFIDENGRKHKKVEFCKTEIHFAAESGRVNIVETDGKPPPTNNFRRRRRTSASSFLEKPITLLDTTPLVDDDKSAGVASLSDMLTKEEPKITATVYSATTTTTTSSSSSTIDEYMDMHAEDISLRGILKNKPLKPKPYHLGENLEKNDVLWGVRLRPVSNEFTSWKAPTDVAQEEIQEDIFKPVSNQIFIKEKEDPIITDTTTSGFSTKINLTAEPAAIPWQQQKESFTPKITTTTNNLNHEMSTTTISIGINNPASISTISSNNKLRSPIEPSDELRSTSLIIRTLKSATQFDDAFRELNGTTITENIQLRQGSGSAFQLVSTSLPKSNSASCILQRSYPKVLPTAKYSSSLDGDCILNSDGEEGDYENYNVRRRSLLYSSDNTHHESNLSVEEKTCDEVNLSRLANFKSFISQNYSEKIDDAKKPIAAPRLKKLETSNVLSHQLSQLRRMYDAAEESDDSAKADEEVNLYLGSLANEKTSEVVSGSWSRIKAKKTSQQTYKSSEITKSENENIRSIHSNKMSIELHSPASSRRAKPTTLLLAPVAQPRKIVPASTAVLPKPFCTNLNNDTRQPTKEELRNLKLSPGTRELKDHELTYFGVRKSSSQATRTMRSSPTTTVTSTKSQTIANTFNTSLLTTSTASTKPQNSPTSTYRNDLKLNGCQMNYADNKWQLTNDKPDLLKHSTSADQKTSSVYTKAATNQAWKAKAELRHRAPTPPKLMAVVNGDRAADNVHIYENMQIGKAKKYDRKLDLQRDEEILDELSRAADEIMNTVKEFTDAEEKKKRSKDATRFHPRPLDTITEKKQTQSVMKARATQIPKDIDDIVKRTHRLCRMSSASSNESISKSSSTHSKQSNASLRRSSVTAATTSSLNHQRFESNSNSSDRSGSRKKLTTSGDSKRILRTSSREKLLSQASSSEDLPNSKVEAPRRPRRLKTTKEREREKESKSDVRRTDYTKSSSNGSMSRHRSDKSSGPHKVHRTTEALITSKSSKDSGQSTKSRSRTERTSTGRSSAASAAAQPTQSSTTTTYVLETQMVPPPRKKRRQKVQRKRSSLLLRKREMKSIPKRRLQPEACLCS